jgi:hypothetical protein
MGCGGCHGRPKEADDAGILIPTSSSQSRATAIGTKLITDVLNSPIADISDVQTRRIPGDSLIDITFTAKDSITTV